MEQRIMVQCEVVVCELLLNETLALKISKSLHGLYCCDMQI